MLLVQMKLSANSTLFGVFSVHGPSDGAANSIYCKIQQEGKAIYRIQQMIIKERYLQPEGRKLLDNSGTFC